jgi:hypothetical protein
MKTCFRCGAQTDLYHNGFPTCVACSEFLTAKPTSNANDIRFLRVLKISFEQVYGKGSCIVRPEARPTNTTPTSDSGRRSPRRFGH